jgi:TetR/AcrR family transcriptional regulator, transcriptional repressor for nem operon
MDTKREIIDAAKLLLWGVGYEAMSPRRLMDESGVGQGSLYHHFRGKQDVAAAALAEVELELRTAADKIFTGHNDPIKAIQAYLLLARDGLKGCRLGRLAQEKTVLDEPGLQSQLARYFEHLQGLVSKALKDAAGMGQIDRSADVNTIAAAIVAVVQGGFVISRATQDGKFITRATKGAAALLSALVNPRAC